MLVAVRNADGDGDAQDLDQAAFTAKLAEYLEERQVDVKVAIENLDAVRGFIDERSKLVDREAAMVRSLQRRHRTLLTRDETPSAVKGWVMPVNEIPELQRPEFSLLDSEITVGDEEIPEDAEKFVEWILEQIKRAAKANNEAKANGDEKGAASNE